LNFAEIFGIRELEFLAIVQRCLHDPTFSRFSRTPTCNRQADRQTHDDGIYGVSMSSRGKNLKSPSDLKIYFLEV